jgi:hypothetical protein
MPDLLIVLFSHLKPSPYPLGMVSMKVNILINLDFGKIRGNEQKIF